MTTTDYTEILTDPLGGTGPESSSFYHTFILRDGMAYDSWNPTGVALSDFLGQYPGAILSR